MPVESDLPADHQDQRLGQKSPGERVLDKEQRCEHHRKIPVVDPAGAAALILQKPCLERAEEQDADHIAHRVGTAKKEHEPFIQNAHHVKAAKDKIKADPQQRDQHGGIIILDLDIDLAGFKVVPPELFLAAGALYF